MRAASCQGYTRVREDGTVVWKHHIGNFGADERPPFDPAAFLLAKAVLDFLGS